MIHCLLINNSAYDLASRERLARTVAPDSALPHVLLATCNRIELYRGDGDAPEHIVRHLCRVASGLESSLTGERAIQGQLKSAYQDALARYRLPPALNRLFQTAIHAGKRVRTETRIAEGAISHSQITADLLRRENIDLRRKTVTLIGVNKLTEDILKYLVARQAANIFLSNRNLEKAETLARHCGGVAMSLANKRALIASTDVLISATSAPHLIVRRADIPPDREMLVFDLAFPRDVEQTVADMPRVKLFNLEDIERHAAKNIALRHDEIAAAERIIEEEIALFNRWQTRRRETPPSPRHSDTENTKCSPTAINK
jgi:glutamyl-tRNA reductase